MKKLAFTQSLFIIFVVLTALTFLPVKFIVLADCADPGGTIPENGIVCLGDGQGGRLICKNGATEPFLPSCGSDGQGNDLCDSNNPAVCIGKPTSTPVPTSPAGNQPCVITQSPFTGQQLPAPVTINSGSAKCVANAAISCTNGVPAPINCTASHKGCTETGNNAICDGPEPTATPAPAASSPTPAPGYWIAQPGYNCGVPVGSPDAGGINTTCCYSAVEDFGDIPEGGINFGPFQNISVARDVLNWVAGGISNSINSLPLPIDPFNFSSHIPFSVKNIKAALRKVPRCLPESHPDRSYKDPACKCVYDNGINPSLDALKQLCANIKSATERQQCEDCVVGAPVNGQATFGGGVWTGLGCINVSENGFINSAVGIGIGAGGGIALMCLIYCAYLLQTSGNSPEGIKKARELGTSCVTGLLLIIFSVFILRVIGYDILKLPGFTP